MTARLYVIPLSHPAGAARGMLAYKRLPHRLISLPPGLHAAIVRAAGFPGPTVPALELDDGRRIQDSMAIARVLDELVEERPLFPLEPAARRAVEDAERWGYTELQPGPRRVFRWALANDPKLRHWLAAEIMRSRAPRLTALFGKLIARQMAASVGASEAAAHEDLSRLPQLLAHVDELIAAGVIGGDAPNAADFQILAAIRVVLEFASIADLVEGRPCAAAARRLFPRWDGPIPATPLPRSRAQLSEGSAGIVASSR